MPRNLGAEMPLGDRKKKTERDLNLVRKGEGEDIYLIRFVAYEQGGYAGSKFQAYG